MAGFAPGTPKWHDQVLEEIIDPGRRIIDAHHHLWRRPKEFNYLLGDLWADTGSGHRIEKSVFIECKAAYRDYGPENLRCVGETEFVVPMAEESAKGGSGRSVIAGIVGHADLTLGDAVEGVLQEHIDAGQGLFRGIRHIGAHDPRLGAFARQAPEGLYAIKSYRQGARVLGRLGLTQDVWHYHHQIRDFTKVARAVPETTFIHNHFGGPIGMGPYAGEREEIFAEWSKAIAQLSECPNVVAKLGGLAMPINGFGWNERGTPPTSDEIVEAQKRYYLHTIESFGTDRCMFESNFPVEKASVSYHVLWNAFKKMVADFTEDEKDALFYGTAARVYKLIKSVT